MYSLLIDEHLFYENINGDCTTLVCNNGHCNQTPEGPICICDEGFIGTNCNQQGADFYHRTLLMPGLADPNVLALNDDLFILMGTADGTVLPIFQSTDLINFQQKIIYNPSASDSANDYCYLWAPNLVNNGNGFDLHFVGQRVSKGEPCPAAGEDVTTFLAQAANDALLFGTPTLVDFGDDAPQGRTATGCNPDGCMKTVRIDPDIVGSGADRWFFYVWFSAGNNIASFPFAAPIDVTANTGPAVYPTPPSEESINEAPEVFWHNEHCYLFFSTAFFNSQYAMSYIMSTSLADLTRNRIARTHSIAERNARGNLVQTHGSNSMVSRRGQLFNVFHQGIFDDAGHMIGRSTFKQRIAFRSDGSIHTLNTIDIRWNELPSFVYSLDVITKNGAWLGPCIATSRIGSSLGTTYMGICPDKDDQLVDKGDVAAFRLYYTNSGTFSMYVETPYDGVSDQLAIYLPGGVTRQIVVRWNERMTYAKYSLDVARSDGSWIAPCVGSDFIFNGIEYVFDGNCRSPSIFINPQDISSIRVCSAINDDWSKAVCSSIPYDGKTIHVSVYIP